MRTTLKAVLGAKLGMTQVWDAATNRVIGSLPLPGRPYAASGGRIWVIGVGGRLSLVQLPG